MNSPFCPSVRLSVKPFSPCSCRRIIMKYAGVLPTLHEKHRANIIPPRMLCAAAKITTPNNFQKLANVHVYIHVLQISDLVQDYSSARVQ